MRLQRLDLLRYGHFTDRAIALPAAERDFHVIVGPNEAGKSTVRSAVLDLLYGIPRNTPLAFVHAMSEMRLGACLEQGGQRLELQRVKGNKQTLRDAHDKPLADDALAPFLGSTDRSFFAQMFGLDHARLVQGGDSILSASNDLGQVLFQSAAGIAGLGAVRDDLQAQADRLWARRRSGDRQYYVALDAFDRATAELKRLTVRSKDWSAAQARVAEVAHAQQEVQARHTGVKLRRTLLDRVRRVAPYLQALDAATAQLAALGEVADLGPQAAGTLAEAERASALAQAEIEHQHDAIARAQAVCDALVPDDAVRAAGADIAQLNEQRLQVRSYPGDIATLQAGIDAAWARVCALAAQLGWDTGSETAVRERLPSVALRAGLERLLRSRPATELALRSAGQALRAKQSELAQAQAELAGLPGSEPPLSLQAALARAQKLGDAEAGLEARRAALVRAQAAEQAAFAALGPWRCDADVLRAMAPPADESIRALAQEQRNDDARLQAVGGRIATLEQQLRTARLDVAQYRRAHQAVTLDEVVQARSARDATWQAIKADPAQAAEHAPVFESQLAGADTLADRRHDTIQQASELQARQDLVERLEQELAAEQATRMQIQDVGAQRTQRWTALAASCGLPALPFDAAAPWLEARAAALAAAQQQDEAQAALAALQAAVDAANADLAAELEPLGMASAEGAALPVRVLAAQQCVQAAAGISGQRRTLEKQVADAQRAAAPLQDALQQAREAADAWQRQWAQALQEAGLDAGADEAAVQHLLDAAGEIDTTLAAMRSTQHDRIDTMRAELQRHGEAARVLATRLAPERVQHGDADIVLQLVSRLAAANAAHQESERQRAAIRAAQHKLDEATGRRMAAQATLAPLLQRAGLSDSAQLAGAIARSDQWRSLAAACDTARRAIREAGDGLPLEQLRAEVAQVDLDAVAVEVGELERQEEELVDQRATLATEGAAARAALAAIGGSADAAAAEAQRQQALADMADSVERYVRLHTASRLLRWSIEQYRELKQGPMLAAASAVFARLTLGSFDKLVVDFEHEPPKLLGRRDNGTLVAIDGMSEGTRDQLYLALRLAALDLHLAHAQALPFLADDLFINYDDARAASGLAALGELSRKTQVLFLTHHAHLLPVVEQVFGEQVNVVRL